MPSAAVPPKSEVSWWREAAPVPRCISPLRLQPDSCLLSEHIPLSILVLLSYNKVSLVLQVCHETWDRPVSPVYVCTLCSRWLYRMGNGTATSGQGAVALTVGSVPRRIVPKLRHFFIGC